MPTEYTSETITLQNVEIDTFAGSLNNLIGYASAKMIPTPAVIGFLTYAIHQLHQQLDKQMEQQKEFFKDLKGVKDVGNLN